MDTALTVKVDLKDERRDLYAPPAGRFVEVDVPEMTFLAVDGHGDPDTSPDYRFAVEALYSVSYAVKFLTRRELGRDHVVMPLEGLWSAADLTAFTRGDPSEWTWTMMIRQPGWVDADVVERARAGVQGRALPALPLVRRETLTEGRCVQALHVGSYDDEGPLLRMLHEEHPAGARADPDRPPPRDLPQRPPPDRPGEAPHRAAPARRVAASAVPCSSERDRSATR